MKKFLSVFLCMLLLFAFGACDFGADDNTLNDDYPVVLAAPDGAPALSVASVMYAGKIGDHPVESRIVEGTEAASLLTQGKADMAVIPLNLAASLYNSGAKIKLACVNVFGCLYMVGKEPINSLGDLKGKVVICLQKNNTPGITLRYVLNNNDVEFVESETAEEGKVAVRYADAGPEVISALKTGKADYGVLGEPAVTNCNAAAGTQVVLDLQAEWKKFAADYTQAGLVVTEKLYNDSAFMGALFSALDGYKWIYDNTDKLAALLESKGSTAKLAYTPELLQRCNIGFETMIAVKADVESYLSVLLESFPNVVGGKLPDAGFYYGAGDQTDASDSPLPEGGSN